MKRSPSIVLAVALAGFAVNFVAACADLLTDSATRAAYDIEKAADAMQRSSAPTYTLVHRPKASPDDCSHDYTFQLSRDLRCWCGASRRPVTTT